MVKTSAISRATIENVALYVFCVLLYSFQLDTLPPKLELFEEWVNNYLPSLSKPWDQMYREFAQVGHNDSNCAVNAPIWLGLVQGSLSIFGTSNFAYRLPTVLLTCFSPVLIAEFVRRYFNMNLALLVGLVVGMNQHIMWFGRTGGYIGPTLTLFLLMLLSTSHITLENNRRHWIYLALTLAVTPFFYSVIRYYVLIPFSMLGYRFLTSRQFRNQNITPLLATVAFVLVSYIPLAQHGIREASMRFISGRGEQMLVSENHMSKGFEAEALPPEQRLSGVLSIIVPQRLADLGNLYYRGNRFFSPRHQHARFDTAWIPLRPWLLLGVGLGVLYCIVKSCSLKRYLIPLIWSTWAFLPLLVTTGVTPNRMFLAVPSDMLLLVFGVFAPVQLCTSFLPKRLVWIPNLLATCLLLWLSYHSATAYFIDYQRLPNL